jgi:hypothetical protein
MIRASLRLLALLSIIAAPAWANGVVHIPEPSSGMASPYNGWSDPGAGEGWFHASSAAILDQGITFGDDLSIVPTIDGLSFVMRPSSTSSSAKIFEFVGNEIQLSNGVNTWVALGAGVDGKLFVNNEVVTGFLTLRDPFGNLGAPYGNGTYPYLSLGVGEISFGDGITASDTNLTRVAPGGLQINGQTIVTQNALANYVTLDGTQTLTNKSINAGQLTGSVTAAKGGTGLTSYTAGDLLFANGPSSLGKLAAASTGNVLLSGTSPSWGKVGLTTHVNGTLPVANGGTGATSLTGILKGNGTGAVTTVAAPAGDLVGTNSVQTISYKTLNAAILNSPRLMGTTAADYITSNQGAEFNGMVSLQGGMNANFGQAGSIGQNGSSSLGIGGGENLDLYASSIRFFASAIIIGDGSSHGDYLPTMSVSDQDLHFEAQGAVVITGRFSAGSNNGASGFASVAFGEGTSATTDNAAAFGFGTIANGLMSMALGDSTRAEGIASLAAGESTVANAFNSVAFGRRNVTQGSSDTWLAGDDLLTVGNGDPDAAGGPTTSNAMALHKNGKLRVANTVESKGGFRTPKMGDIEMGLFTAGPDPTTMNAGLRYTGE